MKNNMDLISQRHAADLERWSSEPDYRWGYTENPYRGGEHRGCGKRCPCSTPCSETKLLTEEERQRIAAKQEMFAEMTARISAIVAELRKAAIEQLPQDMRDDLARAEATYTPLPEWRAEEIEDALAALGAPPPHVPVPAIAPRESIASPVYHPADAMDSEHVVALPDGRYVLRTLRDDSSERHGTRIYESEKEISKEEYLRLVAEWKALRNESEERERRRAEEASRLEAYCTSLPEQLDDETFRKGKDLCDRWGNYLAQIPTEAVRESWSVDRLISWLNERMQYVE